MIETIDTGSAKVVGWKLRGTLHDQDYRQFLPQVESILTTQGKVRLFVDFRGFSRLGPPRGLGRFQVRRAPLFGFRADCDCGRPPLGKVDGHAL